MTAAESASNSLMRLTSDRCHVCHLVVPVIGRLRPRTTPGPWTTCLASQIACCGLTFLELMLLVISFSTNSRPALRAAASGGRPRAGNDTTATGEPASPSSQQEPKHPHLPTKAELKPQPAGPAVSSWDNTSNQACA